MTRINTIPVHLLLDQHVFAEWRELPRIWDEIQKRQEKGHKFDDLPETYRMGPGHNKFFYNKTGWLSKRHRALTARLRELGYNIEDREPLVPIPGHDSDWEVPMSAHVENLGRLVERQAKPGSKYRYNKEPAHPGHYSQLLHQAALLDQWLQTNPGIASYYRSTGTFPQLRFFGSDLPEESKLTEIPGCPGGMSARDMEHSAQLGSSLIVKGALASVAGGAK